MLVKNVAKENIKLYPATPRVANVPLDGRHKTAVSNVSPVPRARSAKVVKIAPWGLLEQEMTMRPNANDATQVLQLRQQVRQSATAAN